MNRTKKFFIFCFKFSLTLIYIFFVVNIINDAVSKNKISETIKFIENHNFKCYDAFENEINNKDKFLKHNFKYITDIIFIKPKNNGIFFIKNIEEYLLVKNNKNYNYDIILSIDNPDFKSNKIEYCLIECKN